MITRHKKITAKNTLLGLAVIMLLSGCSLTGAKLNSAPVPEKSTPAASRQLHRIKIPLHPVSKGLCWEKKTGSL